MSDKSVAQKLMIRAGRKVRFVNAPKGYATLLGPRPKKVTVLTGPTELADVITLFANDRKDLEAHLPKLKRALAPEGTIWVAYHKGTSKTKTDINRDIIAEYARSIGMEGVAMIAINDDWSAVRLKRAKDE